MTTNRHYNTMHNILHSVCTFENIYKHTNAIDLQWKKYEKNPGPWSKVIMNTYIYSVFLANRLKGKQDFIYS